LRRSPSPLLLAWSSTRLTGSPFRTAAAGLPLGCHAAGAAAAAGGFKAESGAGWLLPRCCWWWKLASGVGLGVDLKRGPNTRTFKA
ncbi:hypothetical protein CLOM_g8575, partial [Closterium sp. NIES-68]